MSLSTLVPSLFFFYLSPKWILKIGHRHMLNNGVILLIHCCEGDFLKNMCLCITTATSSQENRSLPCPLLSTRHCPLACFWPFFSGAPPVPHLCNIGAATSHFKGKSSGNFSTAACWDFSPVSDQKKKRLNSRQLLKCKVSYTIRSKQPTGKRPHLDTLMREIQKVFS